MLLNQRRSIDLVDRDGVVEQFWEIRESVGGSKLLMQLRMPPTPRARSRILSIRRTAYDISIDAFRGLQEVLACMALILIV